MKAVDYKHSWSNNRSESEEMSDLFGTLLADYDTSDAYETEVSYLFKKGSKYTWIDGNGCSCWEGDYEGWELTESELMKLADKTLQANYRGTAQVLIAKWVKENL